MAGMRNQRSHKRRLSIPALLLLATGALALSACGGREEDSGGGGSDRAKLEQAALKHAECMRREGIDVPDPKPGQGGLILAAPGSSDPGATKRAGGKCDKYLKDVPPPNLSEEEKTAMRDGALRHARCMRDQGIDFPDPKFDGKGGITVDLGEGLDPADPRMRQAEQKCRKLLPRPPGGAAG